MAATQGFHGGSLVARAGGLHPPPEVILSWPKPNYIDPEERGWEAPIVLIIFMAITFFVYVARMWARISISKNTGLDDILISIAMLPLFGLTITTILGKTLAKHVIFCADESRYPNLRLPVARLGSNIGDSSHHTRGTSAHSRSSFFSLADFSSSLWLLNSTICCRRQSSKFRFSAFIAASLDASQTSLSTVSRI